METKKVQETVFKSAYETIKNNFKEANNSLDYLLKEKKRVTKLTKNAETRKIGFIAQYIDLVKETKELYLFKESQIPFTSENNSMFREISNMDCEFRLKLMNFYNENEEFRNKINSRISYVPLLDKVFFQNNYKNEE